MKGHVIAALMLIIVGTLLLLQKFGFTNVGLGDLLNKWWPAALIIVGLGLLFNRK